MSKRIVIALGGNALGNTAAEQLQLVTETAKAIAVSYTHLTLPTNSLV